MPFAAAWRRNATLGQLRRDLARRKPGASQFRKHRRKLASALNGRGAICRSKALGTISAEFYSARLCRRERVLCSLADLFSLMLSEGGQQMDHELIRMRIIGRDEINAAFHKAADKMYVAGESVELGDDQRTLGLFCRRDGCGKLRAILALAAFDLDKFAN